MERKNAWKSYNKTDEKNLEKLCEGYKDYLFKGKTEREGTKYMIRAFQYRQETARGRNEYPRCSSGFSKT